MTNGGQSGCGFWSGNRGEKEIGVQSGRGVLHGDGVENGSVDEHE